MPFEIVRGDIALMHTDAIVNTANPRVLVGAGVDARIHSAAGEKLLEARRKIGDLSVTDAVMTDGYDLFARYVIHACGPRYIDGMHGEEELLRQTYRNVLQLAAEKNLESISFPLLSAGSYGYPKAEALHIAVSEFERFLETYEMEIRLVVFQKDVVKLSENLTASVRSFIDDVYVRAMEQEEHAMHAIRPEYRDRRNSHAIMEMPAMPAGSAIEEKPSRKGLERFLKKREKGFSETLLEKIDASGKKDAEIYRKANISRKHFSKIRSNPDYHPTKNTVLAFAFALEMDLPETKKFLRTAGYALSRSSLSDVIVEFFLTTDNHDLYELNEVLFLYDQPLIGNVT